MFYLTNKPDRPTAIRTARALAELVGRDPATVCRWLADERWRFGKAPWSSDQLPAIRQWIASELRTGPDPVLQPLRATKLREQVRQIRAQADAAETQLARERAALHDREECRLESIRRARLYRRGVAGVAGQAAELAVTCGLPAGAAAKLQREVQGIIDRALQFVVGAEVEAEL
ncbi:MAG TPA: hypothetical protein VH370_20480 [Humisphaera sp.]|jgi:hypothetical protein|nr:hypothetical protein [Humisphaera sp.]